MQVSHRTSEGERLTERLRSSSEESLMFNARAPIDERNGMLQMVLEGAVLRQRFLADGRGHTVAVYFRNDVINLGDVLADRRNADYLMGLKGTVVGSVPEGTVKAVKQDGGLGELAYRELAIAREHLVSLSQRTAVEAMAHFFCETLLRCSKPTTANRLESCELHMTQEVLASVLGMSSVHVNRTLQLLRRWGLADLMDDELIVYDFERLAALAEFDDAYLAK